MAGQFYERKICGSAGVARLLLRKGFLSAKEVEGFVYPRLKSRSDLFLLPKIEGTVARIFAAI